ncbi:MAG: DNA gyrase subunit A [Nitrospinae bacterium]|nr:DNA gyrase subunit A [Nitrospinota bacterium]
MQEPAKEQVKKIDIEDEMKCSYLDYAMSVIIGRALPDARDGLKPVHRRILHAMNELGNVYNKPYKKSARIVGDVIGKYHPHGDTAVYDTIVRMAQEFSMRYPLVDGQGNFGSIDGDNPAAMRYTEIRMAEITQEILADIEKGTVEFVANYDGSLEEPVVLPSKIPFLLVNGSSGIAVGMATNIPPHNLGEILDGLIAMIENPNIGVDKLMEYVKGPDFPTAGFIHGLQGIKSAYETGRGLVQMRARINVETHEKTERESIIITEIPYQVNKAKLVEKIALLVKEKKLEGISDLRDESDREGIRVVIDLKRGENAQVIINQLYKHTQLQETFGILMLALVNNQPQILNLQQYLQVFLDYRREIVTRRTEFELQQAKNRAHILNGLKVALENIDEMISLIKSSKTTQDAQREITNRFGLDDIQAKAILEMRLQRLTGLEKQKIFDELKELEKKIEYFNFVLENETEKYRIIKEELTEIKKKYNDERRTEIIPLSQDFDIEDLIMQEDMVVTISHSGYIKRNPISLYRAQRRGGKGVKGMEVKEDDFVVELFIANTHDYLLFFTNTGQLHWLKVYEVPEAGRTSKGRAIVNILQLQKDEKVEVVVPVKDFEGEKYLVMITRKGVVKKTELKAFSNPRAGGIKALTMNEGDSLIDVKETDGQKDILLSTKRGLSIRFKETQVRAMGRQASGVKGITLGENDEVVSAEVVTKESILLCVTENGYGKRTPIDQYRLQARGGKGLINIKISERNGYVVGVKQVEEADNLMLITGDGTIIRTRVSEIRQTGRNTQGVRVIDPGDSKVVGLAKLVEGEPEPETEEGDQTA